LIVALTIGKTTDAYITQTIHFRNPVNAAVHKFIAIQSLFGGYIGYPIIFGNVYRLGIRKMVDPNAKIIRYLSAKLKGAN